MLGSSYPTSGGSLPQNQIQAGNNSLSSIGMLHDANDTAPFDINDFPQLTGRPSSAGGPQGQYGKSAGNQYILIMIRRVANFFKFQGFQGHYASKELVLIPLFNKARNSAFKMKTSRLCLDSKVVTVKFVTINCLLI